MGRHMLIISVMAAVPLILQGQFARPTAAEALAFELDFDRETLEAGVAAGNHKPVMTFGRASFRDGVSGKALFCGADGAKVRFRTAGNLDFDRSGSITFWFRPVDWNTAAHARRTMFFGTESNSGYFGIQIANDPKTKKPYDRDIHALIMFSKFLRDQTMARPPFIAAGDEDWHLLSLAWSGNRIFISRDGEPYAEQQVSGPVSKKAFPSEHFSVGADSEWNYLLDEFRIYSRKLTDREVNQVYQEHKKSGE